MPSLVHPSASDIPPSRKVAAERRQSFAPPFFDRLSPFSTVFPVRPKLRFARRIIHSTVFRQSRSR
jgi:hypothetical protein